MDCSGYLAFRALDCSEKLSSLETTLAVKRILETEMPEREEDNPDLTEIKRRMEDI